MNKRILLTIIILIILGIAALFSVNYFYGSFRGLKTEMSFKLNEQELYKGNGTNCTGYEFYNECEDPSCAENEMEQQFYDTFKKFMMLKFDVNSAQFDEHIEVWNIEINDEGQSASIYYVYKDGWLRVRDRIDLNLVDTKLSDTQLLKKTLENYPIHWDPDYIFGEKIISFGELESLVTKSVNGKKFTYDFCSIRNYNSETMYLSGSWKPGVMRDQCHESLIDLGTGKIETSEVPCFIN